MKVLQVLSNFWKSCSWREVTRETMGRGVSSGGGQSSLGYLFGSGEEPKPSPPAAESPVQVADDVPSKKSTTSATVDNNKQIPAGIQQGSQANNYYRADGQNTGNFITNRPSTKVHATPGGGSSLNYLFGGNGGSK